MPFHPIDSLSSLLLSFPLGCGSTIILLTLLFRTGATLPATLWQRARVRRTRELVVPEMRRINGELAGRVARECRARGMGYEEYKKELKSQLATHQSHLHRQHRTHPLPTLLAPLAIHIPLLVTLSLSIRRAVETPGSEWATEAFWWIDKMGEVDTTGILPVVGGVVAMINAELVGRRSKEVGEVLRQEEEEAEGAEGRVTGRVTGVGSGTGVTNGQTGPVSSGSSRPSPGSASRQSSYTANSRSGRSPPSPGPPASPASRSISTSPTPLALPRPRKSPSPKRSTPSGAVPRPPASASASVPPPPSNPRSPSSSHRSDPSGHLVSHAPEKKSFSARAKAAIRNQFLSRAMLVGGVLFIPIAAQVPAALALYWTTSMMYTVVQHLVLNWVDARGKAAEDVGKAAEQAA